MEVKSWGTKTELFQSSPSREKKTTKNSISRRTSVIGLMQRNICRITLIRYWTKKRFDLGEGIILNNCMCTCTVVDRTVISFNSGTSLGPWHCEVSWLKMCPYFSSSFAYSMYLGQQAVPFIVIEIVKCPYFLIERFHCFKVLKNQGKQLWGTPCIWHAWYWSRQLFCNLLQNMWYLTSAHQRGSDCLWR